MYCTCTWMCIIIFDVWHNLIHGDYNSGFSHSVSTWSLRCILMIYVYTTTKDSQWAVHVCTCTVLVMVVESAHANHHITLPLGTATLQASIARSNWSSFSNSIMEYKWKMVCCIIVLFWTVFEHMHVVRVHVSTCNTFSKFSRQANEK